MNRERTPSTAAATTDAPERCIARGRRLVQVKFVALPMESAPPQARAIPAPPLSPLGILVSRVLGLLAVARR